VHFQVGLSFCAVHGKLAYDHQETGLRQAGEEGTGRKPSQLSMKGSNAQQGQRCEHAGNAARCCPFYALCPVSSGKESRSKRCRHVVVLS